MSGLRRTVMRVGLQVGLYEGGTGERLHAAIESLGQDRVSVWVPDLRYSIILPRTLRGYLTALPYPAAAAGAMWPEPVTADHPGTGPTGRDLLAYWAWARRTGADASRYHTALEQVLEAQPGGVGTDLAALNVHDALARYRAAHAAARAASTLAVYSSHFRRALEIYLNQYATASPDATRQLITLGDGRTLTVLAPPTLPDHP